MDNELETTNQKDNSVLWNSGSRKDLYLQFFEINYFISYQID